MEKNHSVLFQPFSLRSGVELKNRLIMAPMTNFSSNEDGTVSDAEVAYYARRSGGVSMVITACTNVTANGKGFPGEFAGHTDEMIPSLHRLASAIQAKGSKAVLQIFHGGRMCPPELVPNGDVVSASNIPADENASVAPRTLLDQEIQEIVRAFGETTRRAIEAGYDGVEIHGANGYLLQQFFSPHANRREDAWGGTLEKRMAFPLAVVDEVQRMVRLYAKAPFLVGYRFSPEEATDPGITMLDTLALVDALAEKELDYLHVSVQDFWSTPRRGVDSDKSRIEWIQDRVGQRVPIIGVGSIHTPDEAVQAFDTGIVLLALGRELIMEPDWVQKVEQGQVAEIQTSLSSADQQRLVIPDPLWQAIMNTPGWFPVVQHH